MTLIDVTASYQRRYYPLVGHRDVQLDIEITELDRKTRQVRMRIIDLDHKKPLTSWSLPFNSGASTSSMFGALARLNSYKGTSVHKDGTKSLVKRKDDPDLARMIESAASRAEDQDSDDKSTGKSSYTWDDVRDYIVKVIPGRNAYLENTAADLRAKRAAIDKRLKDIDAALKK